MTCLVKHKYECNYQRAQRVREQDASREGTWVGSLGRRRRILTKAVRSLGRRR